MPTVEKSDEAAAYFACKPLINIVRKVIFGTDIVVIASETGNTMLQERKSEYQEGATMNLCKGMADWAAEERLEGAFNKAKTVAKNAFSMGFDVEKAATLCEENLQLVQEWFAEWNANS